MITTNRAALVVTVVLSFLFPQPAEGQIRCRDLDGFTDKASPRLRVHGLITDSTGAPIPGSAIRIYCAHSGDTAALEATTDSKGHYSYDLPVRQVSYYVRILHSAFVDIEDSISAKAAGEFERNYRLENPVATLKGVVYNEARRPVARVRVSLMRSPREMEREVFSSIATATVHFRKSIESGADGSFLFSGLPEGSFYLTAFYTADFRSENVRVELKEGESVSDLILRRGRRLSFRVLDESGRPIPGTNVNGIGMSHSGWQNDGTCSLALSGTADLPSSCLVTASGYEAKAVKIDSQALELPDVILSPAPTLEGKVIDEQGRPVTGLRFDLMFYWHTTNPARRNRPQIIGFGGEHPLSGKDGSFKCPVPGFPSKDLDLEVQIRQAGFVAQTLAVSEADMRTGLRLTVKRPAGRVEGQVLGPDGQPLGAFTVSAMYPGSGPSGDYRADRKRIAARMCAYARFAQSGGRFSLEDLPEGELELAATADQAGKVITGRLKITVTKGVPNAPVVIRCAPGPDPTTLW